MYALVMAGGSGTRLWPLSRRKTPKQLLPLTGDASLLQQTVTRLEPLLQPHDIYVITAESHVHATQRQLPQLPEGNILGEPLARSTAVAAALGSLLARRQTDEVAIVLPADHHVADADAFVAAIREAAVTAERGYLVVLGVTPSHPATGYGYIIRGDELFATGTAGVDRVRREAEREGGQGARGSRRAVERGRVRVERLRLPPGPRALSAGADRGPRPDRRASLARRDGRPMPGPSSSRCRPSASTPASPSRRPPKAGWPSSPLDAGWSDIGSWSALLEALSRQSGKSLVASGQHLDRGSQRVLIHGGERLVVTVGLRDVIIVDTPDALLVCARDRAEEIKPILDEIGEATGDRYL